MCNSSKYYYLKKTIKLIDVRKKNFEIKHADTDKAQAAVKVSAKRVWIASNASESLITAPALSLLKNNMTISLYKPRTLLCDMKRK